MHYDEMKNQLLERLKENYADYQADLLTCDRQELIDDAENIAHFQNAYEDVTGNHLFTESQMNHLLQFLNPLEVIASHWPDILMIPCENDLRIFPLVADAQPTQPLHRFMNVDILASLRLIMGQVTASYQSDFEYDKKGIQRAAQSEEPEKRNLLWLCRENGTRLHTERDVFIKGTSSHNHIQFYHHNCLSGKVMLYSIEITGVKNGIVRGNLYERDRHQYAELAWRGSSP